MNHFVLHLQSATQYEAIDGVTHFIGEDDSGAFGLLAGHARMMTTLVFGLARYRCGEQPWQYLAVPGALLYFADNALYLNTRHYLRDTEQQRISAALDAQLRAEEEDLHRVKESLQRMEEEMLKRLWRLGRDGAA